MIINQCDVCKHWDIDYQNCVDEEIFVDSSDGMPCCRHDQNAVKYEHEDKTN